MGLEFQPPRASWVCCFHDGQDPSPKEREILTMAIIMTSSTQPRYFQWLGIIRMMCLRFTNLLAISATVWSFNLPIQYGIPRSRPSSMFFFIPKTPLLLPSVYFLFVICSISCLEFFIRRVVSLPKTNHPDFFRIVSSPFLENDAHFVTVSTIPFYAHC
jgi:hypothetical protein